MKHHEYNVTNDVFSPENKKVYQQGLSAGLWLDVVFAVAIGVCFAMLALAYFDVL
jgi:hypothetical protein